MGYHCFGRFRGARRELSHDAIRRHQHKGAAQQATVIFDRNGPGRGIELGTLTFPGAGAPGDKVPARLFIENQVEPRLVRMCQAGWLPAPPPGIDCVENVHTAGYRVTSTLDSALTDQATGLLAESIQMGLQAGCACRDGAIVSIDPQSGEVLVYVPNNDGDPAQRNEGVVDIDQLIESNSPGTAFTPVAFLAWMHGLAKAPMSSLWDTNPLELDGRAITNSRAGGGSEGLISARAALAATQEVAAFRAASEVGIDAVLEMAARLGITTLAMNFDPTWRSHPEMEYGASLASAGVNVRPIDMAYLLATIANTGVMAGTATLASELDPGTLQSLSLAQGSDYDLALMQSRQFVRGDIRLPGTRELDPIVVLEVSDRDGNLLFTQGEPERKRTIDAGSVWLLHTVIPRVLDVRLFPVCRLGCLDRQLRQLTRERWPCAQLCDLISGCSPL